MLQLLQLPLPGVEARFGCDRIAATGSQCAVEPRYINPALPPLASKMHDEHGSCAMSKSPSIDVAARVRTNCTKHRGTIARRWVVTASCSATFACSAQWSLLPLRSELQMVVVFFLSLSQILFGNFRGGRG